MISPQAQEWLRQRRQSPAFGATGFSLADLRAIMATTRPPISSDVRCFNAPVGDIPGEWVLAPGAHPDLRLL